MAQAPSRAIMLFGTEEPPAETRLLTAGPLTAELDAGNLRYIRYGGREAIRAISYVVRDQFWGTYNPEIRDLVVAETEDSFTVTYAALCGDATQRLTYRARITGRADGSLRFEGSGTPETDFVTNRTGFVVLHGVEGISGHPVQVEEVGGRTVETQFPEVIDPKQPMMEIRALTHQVAPGLKVTCTMLGDTFEMEDQRNWTDASYKTYVRPLGLPHPYDLKAGETIEQAVELRFEGAASSPGAGDDGGEITVRLGAAAGKVPQIGMALEWQLVPAALARLDRLDHLKPAFLSGYFDPRSADGAAMGGFRAVAERLGCELALEAVVPDLNDHDAALQGLADTARDAGARFASVALSPAEDLSFVMPGSVFADMTPYEKLYSAAREAFPGSAIGGGSFMYFTELNRKPPPFDALDFVIHTTCAIVHAADDRSVTETIESLPYVIRSGRALFGDKPYRLGPVGIGTRTSPFGGAPAANPHGGRISMCRNDPRQRGLLGAAWHLGVAARAAEGGVDSLILGAPVGDFGLTHHPGEAPQPWFDDGGGLFPAYHVMRGLYRASGRRRRATEISRPREVQALAFETEAGLELWLANLSGEARQIRVEGHGAETLQVAILDEGNFRACTQDPDALDGADVSMSRDRVTLGAYAVARCKVD
jgi:hypothetical protein